jgi:hypothetical protein
VTVYSSLISFGVPVRWENKRHRGESGAIQPELRLKFYRKINLHRG